MLGFYNLSPEDLKIGPIQQFEYFYIFEIVVW